MSVNFFQFGPVVSTIGPFVSTVDESGQAEALPPSATLAFNDPVVPALDEASASLAGRGSIAEFSIREFELGPSQVNTGALIFLQVFLAMGHHPHHFCHHGSIASTEEKLQYLERLGSELSALDHPLVDGRPAEERAISMIKTLTMAVPGDEGPILVAVTFSGPRMSEGIRDAIREDLGVSGKVLKRSQINPSGPAIEKLSVYPGIVGPFVPPGLREGIARWYVELLPEQHDRLVEVALSFEDSLVLPQHVLKLALQSYQAVCKAELFKFL